jgi:hypothetical protein
MGMYDNVDAPKMDCKYCGEELSNWQTKDTDCFYDTVGLGEVNTFYDYCPNCNTMNTYLRKNINRPNDINDFEFLD